MHSETDSSDSHPLAAAWRREGYETKTRQIAPDTFRPAHAHPFDARVLILEGELTLDRSGQRQTFRAGEHFDLPAGCVHVEHYGPEGATVISGRRDKPAEHGG